MKFLTHTLAVTGMVTVFASGAFAQGTDTSTMTCADFMALSADQQMAAMTSLHSASMGGTAGSSAASATPAASGTSTDASASATPAASGTSTDASATPAAGGTSTDASASATPAAGGTSTDASASATPAAGSAAGSSSATASTDPEVAKLLAACQGNDTALVSDRMSSM